ncbi:RHS repeat-associated core domain-containing protein [Marinobacter sp. S6332]|uniref:RHS repeat-associated core domain-containing protein n=1 Tax=Marinobacter sp. S6332 TaxID=2926403 RepID=UPI001FF62B4B|nr:RHS repeat-associated core domain-containing protein [Marinobacter sp. S6332]MCK0165508.1 DUF6531 domain-containing protein [Marinobacter sp. S6332]
MASHIEFNGADGYKYIVVRPDTYDGPQGPENAEGNEDWSQWLRNRFSPGFANESTQWLSVLQSHGVSLHVASNSDLLFRHVAQMLRERQLAIYKVPLHSLPPSEGSGGGGGGSSTARTGNAPASAASSAPAGSSKAKQADTDDPGANTADMQCQGDPVAPVTGEEILDIEDFVIEGPMPLTWTRRYRSGYCERQLGFGAGWAITCLRQIHLDGDHLWILDKDSRSLRLKTLAPGEITWQVHTGLRVERRQDNQIVLTEANGMAWILATQDNKTWLPVSVQNLTGQQWRFQYDAEFRLSHLRLNAHTAVVFSYNKHHPERVHAIHLENGDQRRLLALYSYDDQGNLLRAESDHGTEQYQYQGRLLTHRELPTGYTFHFEWQGHGERARCLRSRGEQGHHDFQFDYQPERYLTQVRDAHGKVQVFHYDDNGRILARQDPDGALWQWAYDGLGRLVQETRPDGAQTQHRYDHHGRKAETIEPDGRSHRWHYNELGFCTAESLPDGRVHKRRVDLAGRLLSEDRPDGSQWHYQYDADGWPVRATSTTGETTELGCADTGHLLASNRNGQLQRFAFHLDGRVAGKLEQGLVTQYDYQGQRLLAVHQYPEQAPEQKRSRQYHYDKAGRLTDYTTAQGDQHSYEYGPLMRPLAYRRPDGHKVQYQYDLSERLTAITRADGQQWQLGWNAQGHIDRCAAPDGRDIRFQYNAAGHITHREHPGFWAQRTERDPAGRVLTQTSQGKDRKAVTRQYRYDAFGRRTHASCADRKLHWVYNTLGQITKHHQDRHRTTYGYGPGGRIETIHLPDGTTAHYHYDPQGRWHTLSVNGDTLVERTFDSQNRETTRTAGSNTQSQLHDRYGCLIKRKWQGQQSATRRYRWDAENRLEATEDSLTGSTHYQRDSQGQLTQENDTEYHYDLGGNRVPEGGQLQQDRLLTTATDKRDYDALGAEIRITGQTTEHRTFDAEGQLIELKRPSLHITYGYDALGRRAWRKTAAGTTTYLWHNDVLLGEQSPKGDWQWYLRDPQTDEPLITLTQGQPYYYELDHRMMPVRLWDQSGQKVWEGHADAWGKCQPETLNCSIHQPLRLPGQFEDELTGIVQNRFRDYDPATGRYLTPDPLGLQGGINAYRYTKNPLDFVDPLGLEFKAVITSENAETGEDAPILDNLEPVQEIPVAESQLSQRHLRETVGLDTVVVGPNGHGETIGAMYGKVYDPEGNQLPGVDNQAVEAFNDALRQAEKTREYRAEGYKMVAQDAALGMAAGPAAGIVGGAARKAGGALVSKAKGAFGALRKTDIPNKINSQHLDLVTSHPNAHAMSVHGGSVTDAQLIHRAQTGVKPNGDVGGIPKISTAFHSDEALIFADQAVRNNGGLKAAISRNPGQTAIRVTVDDVGDLGVDLGRGFERLYPTGNKKGNANMVGAPARVDNLNSVEGFYMLNQNTNVWETISIFPAPKP